MDQQPSPGQEPEATADRTRPMVLLVEDEPDMRAYLRLHLTPHYEVVEAARGDEGLGLARKQIPDVVVADIMMPGLDGYALCQSVKSDPETNFIPVILLTRKADAQSRLAGLDGGADDYLSKPFDPAELLLRIRNLLRARERLRARHAPAAPAAAPFPGPTPVPIQPIDATFADQVRRVLDRGSADPAFDVGTLAARLKLSRTHLHRRTKGVFGVAPSELILRFRVERAALMLRQQGGKVGEIAHAVGFRDLSHFGRRFREVYDQTPAAYAAAQRSPRGFPPA